MRRARSNRRTAPVRRASPRLPRYRGAPVIAGRTVRCGTPKLPRDFPARIERLWRLAGCTSEEFAEAMGVEPKRVLGWRQGAEPHAGAYHALIALASQIPGGLLILLGEDFLAALREG